MTERIPNQFEATAQDKNLFLTRATGDQLLHFVVEFENRIDEEILSRALRLSLDAEPILGCRLIINDTNPYWERRKDLDDLELLTYSNETEFKVKEFLKYVLKYVLTPTDPRIDPLVQAKLFRSKSDTLCVKVNHVVMDVGGLKEYMSLLSSIYNQLIKNRDYYPMPNVTGDRSLNQLLELYEENVLKKISRKTPMLKPSLGFPCSGKKDSQLNYTVRKIELKHLNEYRKRFRATLNDVTLTLLSRILFKLLKPEPELPIIVHVANDLRRYLPNKKTEAICICVVQYYPKIMIKSDSIFEETLVYVKRIMDQMKADNLGLGAAFFQNKIGKGPFSMLKHVSEEILNQVYEVKKANPILSNFGEITESMINFNNLKVNEAYVLAPTFYLPNFLLGVSSFKDSLFFSVGHNETETFTPILDDFFNIMEDELKKIGIDGVIKVI